MNTVTTFEQEMEQVSAEKTPIRRTRKVLTPEEIEELDEIKYESDEKKRIGKELRDEALRKKANLDKHNSVSDKLNYDANAKLNYYLKKSPHYQIIDSQIKILKTEATIYKKNNSIENYEKTKDIINELTGKLKELKTIFKTGESFTDANKKTEIAEKVKTSPIIIELRKKRNDLTKEIKNSTPTFIIKTLSNLKKQVELSDSMSEVSDEISSFEDEFDAPVNKNYEVNNLAKQEYYDYCGFIADIIGWSIQEIIDSKFSQIKNELENCLEDNQHLKDEINKINIEIQNETSSISGATKLTDLMFDIFDFKTDTTEGKVPKELLAASNINLVKQIAYNSCVKNGSLHQLDDAVAAGLLGLTVAINSWYTTQVTIEGALNFKGYANIYISGAIQRELLNLMGQGRMKGSVLATAHTLNKQKLQKFVKNNPQFKDLDEELLTKLLASYDDSFKPFEKTETQTEYSNNVTGDEGDSADVWANVASSDDNVEDFIEGKIEYEKMLESIKELLNLFEEKEDKKTGLIKITNTKIFNKYDKKLFLMYFGLSHKITKNNPDDVKRKVNGYSPGDYTQEEMAIELMEMYEANGESKHLTGSAVSTRISVLLTKLKKVVDANQKLKAGFAYFLKYWEENTAVLEKLSNSREEVGMKLDIDELKDIYDGDEEAMNSQLSHGTKLSEIFEISDTNPLDDEIFGMFNDEEF